MLHACIEPEDAEHDAAQREIGHLPPHLPDRLERRHRDEPRRDCDRIRQEQADATGNASERRHAQGRPPGEAPAGHRIGHPADRPEQHEHVAKQRTTLKSAGRVAFGHDEDHPADRHRDTAQRKCRGALPAEHPQGQRNERRLQGHQDARVFRAGEIQAVPDQRIEPGDAEDPEPDRRPQARAITEGLPALNRPQQRREDRQAEHVAQRAERERIDHRQAALGDRKHRRPAQHADGDPCQALQQVRRWNIRPSFRRAASVAGSCPRWSSAGRRGTRRTSGACSRSAAPCRRRARPPR